MKISACLLNWRRPQNVRANVDALAAHPDVDEILVWSSEPRHTWADCTRDPFDHWPAVTINSTADLGLHTRFASAALCRNPAVLILDDDLALPRETVDRLIACWLDDPHIVHGIFGRRLSPDGNLPGNQAVVYGGGNCYGDVPIVLTRALIFARKYAPAWLAAAQRFDVIFREGRPFGNGEDILLSYVARKASGRLNRAHDLPRRELPPGVRGVAIHTRSWAEHLAHRTRLCRALETWLKEP